MLHLTCVINVRNGAKYVREALQSLVNQSVVPEILVVDNQSTDNTESIVREFRQARLIRTPKSLALGEARNFSIEHVNTPLIAWLDSDDQWHDKEFCRDHIALFLENPSVVAVSCGAETIDASGARLPNLVTGKLSHPVLYSTTVTGLQDQVLYGDTLPRMLAEHRFVGAWCSYVFSTEAVRRTGLFDAKMEFAEDFDLVANIVSQGLCLHIKKAMCKVRIHSESATRTLDPEIVFGEILQVCEKFSHAVPPKEFSRIRDIIEFKKAIKIFQRKKNLVFIGSILQSLAKPTVVFWIINWLIIGLRKNFLNVPGG